MKKNVKAIVAALSASIMCAVPVAASFANTTAVTGLTAEAAADIIDTLAQPSMMVGTYKGVANNALVYEVDPSTGTATLDGRYSNTRSVVSADKVKLGNRTYKVTSVKDDAFKTTTVTAYTVNKFVGGKYLERVGNRAFQGTVLRTAEFRANKPIVFGDSSFRDTSLSEIVIPAGSTVGAHAFEDNRWLERVEYKWVIGDDPSGLFYNNPLYLDHGSFNNCPRLTEFASTNRRYLYIYGDSFTSTSNIWFNGFVVRNR